MKPELDFSSFDGYNKFMRDHERMREETYNREMERLASEHPEMPENEVRKRAAIVMLDESYARLKKYTEEIEALEALDAQRVV